MCFIGLEIVPFEHGAYIGGLPNNVVQLARGLTQRGGEVFILTSDVNRICRQEFTTPWAKIKPLPLHGKYNSVLSNLEFLAKAIPAVAQENSRRKFDILHLHSGYPIFGLVSLLPRALVRVPVAFTLYSPIQPRALGDRKGIYQQLSAPFLSRRLLSGMKLIAVSRNVKQSLMASGFKEVNVAFLPPAIDTDRFHSELDSTAKREELGIAEETPLVLYCGSWAGWKGIDILLESIAHVKEKLSGVRLVTAWGEPHDWYDERKETVQYKIEALRIRENVIEVGIVNDMERLMAAANVFVAPFLNTDGVADCPLSILEAMSCGTPVIATKVGGIPEIVTEGRNGLLVTAGNARELADAILFMLRNRQKAEEMGVNAASFVRENFGLGAIAEKQEEIYTELLNAKS